MFKRLYIALFEQLILKAIYGEGLRSILHYFARISVFPQVIQAENKKTQITRKIQQLTGFESTIDD